VGRATTRDCPYHIRNVLALAFLMKRNGQVAAPYISTDRFMQAVEKNRTVSRFLLAIE
jgi:hypothetical protein